MSIKMSEKQFEEFLARTGIDNPLKPEPVKVNPPTCQPIFATPEKPVEPAQPVIKKVGIIGWIWRIVKLLFATMVLFLMLIQSI